MDMSVSKLWEMVKDRDADMLQSMEWQRVWHYWATETTAKNASSTLKGPAALLTDCSGQEGAAEGTPAAGGGKPREKGLQLTSCQDWREEQEEMNRQTSSASSTGQALCQAFYKSYLALIQKKKKKKNTTVTYYYIAQGTTFDILV